jgi:predicted TIM-barrel fold metal-dependent hydrolase
MPDSVLARWLEPLLAELPDISFFDAHTHTGCNDPDGNGCSAEELIAALEPVNARAVVFTTQEPAGYSDANDRVLAEAAASAGRLVPFCRLDPHSDALGEAVRCLDRGARGIKLHPRAEGFTLDQPEVRDLFALAHERRVPIMIHAGRGIPALGAHALALAREFPDASIILAHAAVCDLSWIWRELPGYPNVFIDTSWWNPADLLALFALVPPGHILFASDAPYGNPALNVILTLRCAMQAGLSHEQIRAVAGAQLERLLAAETPIDEGPPPGSPEAPADLLLDCVFTYLAVALGQLIVGAGGDDPIGLARLACAVGEDMPQAAVCRTIDGLLETQVGILADEDASTLADPSPRRPALLAPLLLAATVARTPAVAVPPQLVAD